MNENVEQWVVRKNAVESERGVVAARNWMAARAGAGALAKGGNAVDAAIACAFALNATEPWMCGMGGSGYMVIWLAAEQRAHMIDFQGVLPMGIDRADHPLDPAAVDTLMGFPGVVDDKNVTGYGAITVPGAVAGLSLALEKFGALGFDTVLGPAIQLAERGLAVDWFATLQIALEAAELAKDPAASAVYLPGGQPPRPEQYLPLGALPDTLRALAENGPGDFYEGALAERLVRDLRAGGTSHMSAIDAEGNMVALTYTLLNRFGSKIVLPGTGIVMNNSVSYFDPRPGYPTSMEGGKRINSSNMCPTIAVRDGAPLFAVGASGANHIVPCTTLLTAFLLDYGMSLEEAFNTPRLDAGDRNGIRVDPAMGDAVLAELGEEFALEVAQALVFPKLYACPSGVMRDSQTGRNFGISEKSQPSTGAAAEAPFALDGVGTETVPVRA